MMTSPFTDSVEPILENILGFERVFPELKLFVWSRIIVLTQNILNAANGVIANNTERKEKNTLDREPGGRENPFPTVYEWI